MLDSASKPPVKFIVAVAGTGDLYERICNKIDEICQQYGFNRDEHYALISCFGPEEFLKRIGANALSESPFMLIVTPRLGPYGTQIDLAYVLRNAAASGHSKVVLLDVEGSAPPQDPRVDVVRGTAHAVDHALGEKIEDFLNDFVGLLEYILYVKELTDYKRNFVTPLPLAGIIPLPSEEIERKWKDLQNRIAFSAGRLFEEGKKEKKRRKSNYLVVAQALLRLKLEAAIFALRAAQNYRSFESAQRSLSAQHGIIPVTRVPPGFGIKRRDYFNVARIARHCVRAYIRQQRQWDIELVGLPPFLGWLAYLIRPRYFFRSQFGDADMLYELAQSTLETWQKTSISAEQEPGWVVLAPQVQRELRYHSRDQQLHELWIAGGVQLIIAVLFWLNWLFTGFGLRPGRVGLTLFIVPLFFAGAYFADDTYYACSGVQGPGAVFSVEMILDYLRAFGEYIFISITTLATIGSQIPNKPCGQYSGIITSTEAIMGFFLLAVVASIFIEIFFERDR